MNKQQAIYGSSVQGSHNAMALDDVKLTIGRENKDLSLIYAMVAHHC
jgi:hypothetical protein